jgi:hypothetical protein
MCGGDKKWTPTINHHKPRDWRVLAIVNPHNYIMQTSNFAPIFGKHGKLHQL